MRNVYLVIFSTLLSVVLIYVALIVYTFFNFENEFKHTFNVSRVVENIANNEKNITHINFSEILLNDNNFNYKNIWLDNLHLNTTNHGNLFIRKILDELSKYLL